MNLQLTPSGKLFEQSSTDGLAVNSDDCTRWLSSAERAAWLSLAGVLVKLPSALDAQLQRDSGLSYMEYMVLAMLSEQPDRSLRMSELAGTINASLSRLSHIARRLERQQLIIREPDQTDGRSTNAVLTDQGLAKVVSSAAGHVAAVRQLVIDALTPDQLAGLSDAGNLIMARIGPHSRLPTEVAGSRTRPANDTPSYRPVGGSGASPGASTVNPVVGGEYHLFD